MTISFIEELEKAYSSIFSNLQPSGNVIVVSFLQFEKQCFPNDLVWIGIVILSISVFEKE